MNNELESLRNGNLSPAARAIEAALARIKGRKSETKTAVPQGKAAHLLFALDLTASREHTLADARIAIATMFGALAEINAGIAVRLAYFRGWSECRASGWHSDPEILTRAIASLSCSIGYTQIEKILQLALEQDEKLRALVYVGDACEEKPGKLMSLAARLPCPIFVFHDLAGNDPDAVERAEPLFRRMAEVTGGAYSPFGEGSAAALRELLSTVAAFSAGGVETLKQVAQAKTPEARQLQARLLLGPGAGAK